MSIPIKRIPHHIINQSNSNYPTLHYNIIINKLVCKTLSMNSQICSIKQQLQNAQSIFHQLTQELEKNRLNQVAIRRAMKKYDLKNMKVNDVTPLRARRMFDAIKEKYENGLSVENNWFENQRRIFIWCLLCYLHQLDLQISEMKPEHFEFMNSIFPAKDIELIKFQSYSLIKKSSRNEAWSKQQDDILRRIVQKSIQGDKPIQWSTVSKQFFIQGGQIFFRSSKQCRERWLNHLDPHKIKGQWDVQQDKIILLQVLNNGKKWSKIAHILENKRNEHMVKNRYKSLIHKKEKTLKSHRIKQNDVIRLILEDLNINNMSQQKIIGKEDQEDSDKEMKLVDSEKERSSEEINQKERNKRQKIFNPKILQGFSKVVQSPLRKQSFEEMSIHSENSQMVLKGEQPKNELQIIGRGQNNDEMQMMDRIIQNANTPTAENRFSYMFDTKSPNFVLSPFQPPGWTPTIFFMEDRQGQISPQVGFGNFSSKCMNDFGKFIQDDQSNDKNK